MRFNNLQSWLSWQENLHSVEIDLGLGRVQQVAIALGIPVKWSVPVIMVAGTNGKGSSVSILESIYHHAGYKVGSYTSPHLINYNERIKINRHPVSDELICHAFEKIDQARQLENGEEISLTYFEFGTLAALTILNAAELDVVILEVGLGGRLDAVNIVDASVALITPIAIDHQSWLGNTREEIAAEKAGIIKANSLTVYNDPEPADAVSKRAKQCASLLHCLHRDFDYQLNNNQWQFTSSHNTSLIAGLPKPSLAGEFQLQNAAAAIQVTKLLSDALPFSHEVFNKALLDIKCQGRFEKINSAPDIYIDVAHNAHAVAALAVNLQQEPCAGRTIAVMAMLEDKAICDALKLIDSEIDVYYLAGLQGNRALSVQELKQRIQECISDDKLTQNETVEIAIKEALAKVVDGDRIIVFGSFITVSEAIQTIIGS